MPTFHDAKTGAAITVKVTPHAKTTEVAGVMDDGTIRIHVAAAPEAGAANQALVEFLASALSIPANQVDIIAGHTGERKLISLIGITPAAVEEVMTRLSQAKKVAKVKKATAKVAKRKQANNNKKPAKKKKR
jgi:hypothetical protein